MKKKNYFLLVSYLLLFACDLCAQQPRIDSLLVVLNNQKQEDTAKVKTLNHLIKELLDISEYEKALEYAERVKQISGNIVQSAKLGTELWNTAKKDIATSFHNIGNVHWHQGNYEKALENYFASLKIREEVGDKKGIADCYVLIGIIYRNQNRHDKAVENYNLALNIYKELNIQDRIAMSYNNIGTVYGMQGNYEKALENYFAMLKIIEETGNRKAIATAHINIGGIYHEQAKAIAHSDSVTYQKQLYSKALEKFFASLKLLEEIGDKKRIAITYINIGSVYLEQNKIAEAKKQLLASLNIAQEIGAKETTKETYRILSICDSTAGNCTGAFQYYQLYTQIKDSMLDETSAKSIAEMETKYETEKKEKQIEIQNLQLSKQEFEINKKQITIYAISSGLTLMLLLALVIYRGYAQKNKLNKKLIDQNIIIEHKNQNITASIDYASRIQNALLPPEEKFKQVFSDAFIFFQPKDIVSGDFYWGTQLQNKVIFAAVDCTGHGVPGAFMSLIGSNLLDKIIGESHIVEPNQILDKLHLELYQRLHQHEHSTLKDGMDIVVCSYNIDTNELELAGANNSAYIISNNLLMEIKTDRYNLGDVQLMKNKKFIKHTVQLKKHDIVYLFTDGLPDQPGGTKNKKFFYRHFKELLQSIHHESTTKQKEIIADTMKNWIGAGRQLDDMLVMGLKV